nr:DUF4158 domain-containing protein [Sphingobium sp. TKS]
MIGRWSLSFADIDFVNSKPALTRLGLAAQLKFFASLGFFAIDPGSIPTDGLSYLAEQLGVEAGEIAGYDFSSRTARRHCAEILIHPGYHRMKRVDRAQLTEWIAGELCPGGQSINAMLEGSVAKIVKLEHAWRRLDGRNDDGFQVAPFPG